MILFLITVELPSNILLSSRSDSVSLSASESLSLDKMRIFVKISFHCELKFSYVLLNLVEKSNSICK